MAVNEREVVLDMLLSLREGKLSHTILKDTLDSYLYLDKSSRGFITRLYEGSIEKRLYLDFIIDGYSKTPVKKMKPIIMLLLEISVYQLFFMDRVPDSAAINEAVKLAKKRGLTGLSGFVNGVLRNIARNKENIALPDKNKDLIQYLEIKYSTPKAVVEHFINDYGSEKTEEILEAFEEKRPLVARATKNREELIKKLDAEGVRVSTDTIFPESLKILELDSLSYLESFEEGDFVLQDESSQFIGKIVSLPKGARVLDLCAAPGGKSLLFAGMEEVDEIISCDITENKTELIEENVRRIGASKIKTKMNDASLCNPDFVDGFDLVICDLPCSGLGVMGRKRDIKYNVTEDKIRELAKIQRTILENAVRYVKKGGRLIYSTCTMTKAENEENFTFISEFKGFSAVDFSDKIRGYVDRYKDGKRLVNEAKKGFIRLIPGELGTDGFFVSEYMREE
ncbi:16S rRNA (cytosine(967)-C(5))-methyltransferase RsmB [Catonella massiliensis]|uniref:16S rRNA (cytosine(967)-C(5))-methyltransferase n=1 Tax=Catonella massiliensis TaxID=2799636 RepID=A0ABS1J126_9FIRM|nr:16S rRNA (cytosine(967)-C(5))-methyltransferase RsmB [Catonella massiliensis]MBK5897851.1 16S rRNA (cytosine(967)-C(5))-methyltransferase RsmB [Catonella massiliensis]